MFDKLAHYILNLPSENVPFLHLEEVALCATWLDSLRDYPEAVEQFSGLRMVLDRWVNAAQLRSDETEGVRQQPLLRNLINDVVQGRVDGLARDELDVVFFAWGLMERSGRDDLFERPLSTLKPFVPQIRKARENLPLAPGLTTISERYTIALAEDLRNAEARDVKHFAGIDLPFRGPALVCKGDLKIIGDVPDFAAVVAENGGCFIDGALHGFAAASDTVEVYGNISGVAVARRGPTRCAVILNHGVAISKEENVNCIAGEGPKRVFGGRQILVRNSVTGGHWLTRDFQAGGDVAGGELHVSRAARARAFRCSEERPLSIVLRRSLGCQDYGEVLTADALKSLSAAMKLRQQAVHIEKLEELTRREADDFAGGVLYFMFGEDNTRDRLQKIQIRRRRESYFSRLGAGVQNLIGAIEDRLSLSTVSGDSAAHFAVAAADDSARGILESLERELHHIESEGPVERDCYLEREETLSLGRALLRRAITEKRLYELLNELLLKEAFFAQQASHLAAEIRRGEAALENAIGRTAILEKAREECARVEIMDQLVRAGKSKGGQDRVRRRVSDRFVKLMQRNIMNRQSRSQEYRASGEHCETRIREIRDRLWSEYQLSLPMHVIEEGLFDGARVDGNFDPGVTICAWKHLLEDAHAGDSGLLVTPEGDGAATAYMRTPMGMVEPC